MKLQFFCTNVCIVQITIMFIVFTTAVKFIVLSGLNIQHNIWWDLGRKILQNSFCHLGYELHQVKFHVEILSCDNFLQQVV